MKREIKFKVWDTKDKKMYNTFDLYEELLCDENGQSKGGGFATGAMFLQFTGLKDKNGKEIYEGDIFEKGLGEVVWSNYLNGWAIKWHNKTYYEVRVIKNPNIHYDVEPLWVNKFFTKVVGNIFENPGLIK